MKLTAIQDERTQNLFEHFAEKHGKVFLEPELNEIIKLVREIPIKYEDINRVEMIDETGLLQVKKSQTMEVSVSLQDNNQTLKIFAIDK